MDAVTVEASMDMAPVHYDGGEASAWVGGYSAGADAVKAAIVAFFTSQGKHATAAEVEAYIQLG